MALRDHDGRRGISARLIVVALVVQMVLIGGVIALAIDGLPFGSRGGIAVNFPFPLDATYTISTSVAGFGDERLEVSIDGEPIRTFDIKVDSSDVRSTLWFAIGLAIWGPYMYKSERVKNTFVED